MREAQSPSIDWAPLEIDTEPRSWPNVTIRFLPTAGKGET